MKGHIKRLSVFLLYTLVYNTISSGIYVFQQTFLHNSESIGWFVFGIAQVCFTILFFNKVPLPKVSNEKQLKTDSLIYFLILCVASSLAEMGIGIIFLLPNTYTFSLPFDSLPETAKLYIYLGICLTENALKAFMLYTNSLKKPLSKAVCIILGVIMIIAYIVFLCLLARGV